MDESWRMRMGMPTPPPPAPPTKLPIYPPRRSTEDHRRKQISDDDPEDFTDVFGGPPRTVLSRQFSACTRSSSSASFFYEEIFRPVEKAAPPVVKRGGRSLPEFMIPGNLKRSENINRDKNGFYSDIFGWDDERVLVRSRSRSKASSSSVLSSEELSPIRPAFSGEENDDVSVFGMKLRPINVKSRWNATRMGDQRQENVGSSKPMIYSSENENYPFGLNRRNASPETISVEPMSNGSFRVSTQPNSSPNSSLCQSPKKTHEEIDELDEVMSSYVIEINSDNNKEEGTIFESNGVDEAIAWAKQKFQTQELQKPTETEEMVNGSEGHTESFGSLVYNLDEQQDKWASEEDSQQFESKVVQTEMQILDEKIRLWSTGKEDNLRLLLSSLHHILWPSSGWVAIPLTNVIESSQVKKAYQKARLCLHPDKLQQRGATLPQKYIAEKAFSILQEAWAAFISQDFFCH